MDIFEQVSEAIKQAIRARSKTELEALRGIKKELLEAKTSKEACGTLTDAMAVKVIQKMVKQGRDAAAIFVQQNRQDLAKEYLEQVAVYERYLPARMSDADLEKIVRDIIAQTGVTSIKEMGKVIGLVSKQIAGQADGRAISEMVKKLLS